MLSTNLGKKLFGIAMIATAFTVPLPVSADSESETEASTSQTPSPIQEPPPVVPHRRFLPFIPKSRFLPLGMQNSTPQPRQPVEPIPASVKVPENQATYAGTDSALPISPSSSTLPASPDEQTYSVRLPLATPGSVIPKIYTPPPAAPPTNTFLPSVKQVQATDYKRPVAWRATAEAARNQSAGSGLVIATVNADFKTIYNSVLQEAQTSGWNVVSDSVQAGHVLMKIPKQGDPDDAAAWLILVASPIDSSATEVRLKIQTKRPSTFTPQVNEFMQRLQLRATGNKLL